MTTRNAVPQPWADMTDLRTWIAYTKEIGWDYLEMEWHENDRCPDRVVWICAGHKLEAVASWTGATYSLTVHDFAAAKLEPKLPLAIEVEFGGWRYTWKFLIASAWNVGFATNQFGTRAGPTGGTWIDDFRATCEGLLHALVDR
jgi:hypothetical protein